MSDSVSIRFPIYRDANGNPTCAMERVGECALWHPGECETWCGFDGAEIEYSVARKSYQPSPSCPIWSHADRGPGFTHSGDNGVDCGCRT